MSTAAASTAPITQGQISVCSITQATRCTTSAACIRLWYALCTSYPSSILSMKASSLRLSSSSFLMSPHRRNTSIVTTLNGYPSVAWSTLRTSKSKSAPTPTRARVISSRRLSRASPSAASPVLSKAAESCRELSKCASNPSRPFPPAATAPPFRAGETATSAATDSVSSNGGRKLSEDPPVRERGDSARPLPRYSDECWRVEPDAVEGATMGPPGKELVISRTVKERNPVVAVCIRYRRMSFSYSDDLPPSRSCLKMSICAASEFSVMISRTIFAHVWAFRPTKGTIPSALSFTIVVR
mmetsp:Transcript_54297/g.172432  ORF Transcript_54297/g.172432 Transcript_54297/m.172432 type:complete len:299 (-) Transcript_54297:311-1207(-)